MKKHIPIILIALFFILFSGCPVDNTSNNHPEKEPNPNDNDNANKKTWVHFVNNNDFYVIIYSDISRTIKIAEAGANTNSLAIEVDPNSSGALFYPTFHILIDDVSIPYEASVKVARIDAGKTKENSNAVTIDLLEELSASELTKPLSTAAFVKIQNDSSSSLSLRQGNSEITPAGFSSTILMGGETGLYQISASSVSIYSLRKNTVDPINFPGSVTQFASARLYSFRFNGSSLDFLAERSLTLAQVFAISPPESINARALPSGDISLNWDRVGTETSYKIYRAQGNPETFNYLASTSDTSYTDSSVVLGNTYYYKLSSAKGSLESDKSNNHVSALAEISILNPPSGLNATAQGANSILLTWNSAVDAASYKIYRGVNSGNVNTYVAATASTSYLVNELTQSTGYFFTVSSVSANSESLPSSPVYGQTSAGIGGAGTVEYPPVMPTGLTVTSASYGSVSLGWNASTGSTQYNVYRSNTQSGASSKVATVSSTSYTDYVPSGVSYYYSVTGVNSSGESPKSVQAFAFASDHWQLPYTGSQTYSISPGTKHYYRLQVNSGQQVTIQWQDGNSNNVNSIVRVSAWQPNGTSAFSNEGYGFTNPKIINASSSGFITVEVSNISSSISYNYRVYYY